MWEFYKKTFVWMQGIALAFSTCVFLWSHLWLQALTFFAVMQVSAFLGAAWGYSLKQRISTAQSCRLR